MWAEASHSLKPFGDGTAPPETSSKLEGPQSSVTWQAGDWMAPRTHALSGVGANQGTIFQLQNTEWASLWSPHTIPQWLHSVHFPLFLNHLIIWQQLFVIWKRKLPQNYCLPLETSALLPRWWHLINVGHACFPSPTPTQGWCGNRKTLAYDEGLLWFKPDSNAICTKAWKRAGSNLKPPQPREPGPPTSPRLRLRHICFGKFGHFSELTSQPQDQECQTEMEKKKKGKEKSTTTYHTAPPPSRP